MKKKMIMLIFLAGGAIASSGTLYSAQTSKVGIQASEMLKAQNLAKNKGYKKLYHSLGGFEEVGDNRQPLTEDEITDILWPVLVDAIESGNLALTKSLLESGIISTDAKKPYGLANTPLEIAQYHNQKAISNWIIGYKRLWEDFHAPEPVKSITEQIQEDPWSWLSAYIEAGELDRVKYIMETKRYIGVKDRRNAPGVRSHGKTAVDIAEFNLNRSRTTGKTALAEKQKAIVAYLESLALGG